MIYLFDSDVNSPYMVIETYNHINEYFASKSCNDIRLYKNRNIVIDEIMRRGFSHLTESATIIDFSYKNIIKLHNIKLYLEIKRNHNIKSILQ